MVTDTDRIINSTLISLLQRVGEGLFASWAAVTFAFFALRLVTGDPTAGIVSQGLVSAEQLASLRAELSLDQSLILQYQQYLSRLIHFDLGTSFHTRLPVSMLIMEQLKHTLVLAFCSLFFMLGFGLLFGTLAGWKRDTLAGKLASNLSDIATTLPITFSGILALFLLTELFGTQLSSFMQDSVMQLLVPAVVLGFSISGAIARILRTSLQTSMQQPYMLAARARGIHHQSRLLWHALRPVLPPFISITSLEIAYLFSGTVVTETIFSRPGLGRLLISSILQNDYPVAQGIVALAAIFYTLSQMLSDLINIAVDPRLRRIN